MLLENSLTLGITPDQLVPLLADLERIAPCLPGASITERVDDRTYKGRVVVKVGPVTVRYEGTMTVLEVDPIGRRLVMRGEGRDPHGAGNAAATITMTVTATDEGGSLGTIQSDVAITGRVAQFGRGLMQDVADRLLTQFSQCVEASVTAESREMASPGGGASPGDPTASASPSGPATQSVGMLGILFSVLWRRLRGLFGGSS
ncbi:MAG TPA: SRPBCC family protein [Candidatus Nanopelagicaceae bacterium]|nr:SRPBCC family protein [Candidatus Nanopelagicaceae bacterium]